MKVRDFYIPFNDLREEFHPLKDKVNRTIKKVLESGIFIHGEQQAAFEEQFASYCRVKYCFGVNSGTDALYIALKAIGVDAGDEVIIPANSYIATAVAVSLTGAKTILVDIDERSYNINPALIEQKISRKTKAIIPVHLYGQVAEMDSISAIARKHKLYVLEDASQAHGSKYKGKLAGSLGDIAAFSFYPTKNLGAYGDGGAITTNNAFLANRVKLFKNSGQTKRFYSVQKGLHSNLEELQAVILLVKLKYLDKCNKLRQNHAVLYNKLFKNTPVISPKEIGERYNNYHLYVVRVKQRDKLIKYLSKQNIETFIHYPIPIHLQPTYSELGYFKGDYPVSEKCAKEIISLPLGTYLTSTQIYHVVNKIKDYFNIFSHD